MVVGSVTHRPVKLAGCRVVIGIDNVILMRRGIITPPGSQGGQTRGFRLTCPL